MSLDDHTSQYRKFLERLREARIQAGLTQTEVAVRLGKPQSYVSKCETGERRVDVVELHKFADLYKKRLEFFLENELDESSHIGSKA